MNDARATTDRPRAREKEAADSPKVLADGKKRLVPTFFGSTGTPSRCDERARDASELRLPRTRLRVFASGRGEKKNRTRNRTHPNTYEHILAEPGHGEIRLDTAVLIQPLGIDHPTRYHINIVGTYRTQHAGSVATFQPEFSEGGLIE